MSQVVFFLTKLKNPSERNEYEEWVRGTDIPVAKKLKGVRDYRVIKLDGPVLDGISAPAYDYIEIIEIDDIRGYQAGLAEVDPEILKQFMSFIGEMETVDGYSID